MKLKNFLEFGVNRLVFLNGSGDISMNRELRKYVNAKQIGFLVKRNRNGLLCIYFGPCTSVSVPMRNVEYYKDVILENLLADRKI